MKKMRTVSALPLLAEVGLRGYLTPLLAMDAALPLRDMTRGLNGKNWHEKKKDLKLALDSALKAPGKLAKDADINDLSEVLDQLDAVKDQIVAVAGGGNGEPEMGGDPPMDNDAPADGDAPSDGEAPAEQDETGGAAPDDGETGDAPPDNANDDPITKDADTSAAVLEFLSGKLSDEDMDAVTKMMSSAEDDAAANNDDDEPVFAKDNKDPPAMDAAAIKMAMDSAAAEATKAVIKRMNAIREAEQVVRPYVGNIAMAMDSADAVYRHALTAMGVDHAKVKDTDALRIILTNMQTPADRQRTRKAEPAIAMDAAASASFESRYPNRLKHS